MEQLVVDIHNEDDARLIKALLARFKKVEVMSFTPALSLSETQQRISQGIADADVGNVKPWSKVKTRLAKKIKAHK